VSGGSAYLSTRATKNGKRSAQRAIADAKDDAKSSFDAIGAMMVPVLLRDLDEVIERLDRLQYLPNANDKINATWRHAAVTMHAHIKARGFAPDWALAKARRWLKSLSTTERIGAWPTEPSPARRIPYAKSKTTLAPFMMDPTLLPKRPPTR
jgi:hypothetical protein